MRSVICIFSVFCWSLLALAQTPQEIISRMDAEIAKHRDDGIVMVADSKIPVLGNMTVKTYATDDDDMGFFSGIIDGYDVTVQKETADAWYILCKKNKSNKEKDAPKNMDLVVEKKNCYPKSLSFKMSGISMTLRDIAFGVTEKQVTFNPANYPGAKIIDKR